MSPKPSPFAIDESFSSLMTHYPLIRIFEYGQTDFLVYDARMHFAFVLSREEYPLLISYLQGNLLRANFSEHEQKLVETFDSLRAHRVLLPGPNEHYSPTNRRSIEEVVDYWERYIAPGRFVLEVTDECSLRCKYCRNTYSQTGRRHGHTKMTRETAFESIDYYFDRYTTLYMRVPEQKRPRFLANCAPTLAWYGGEPFLNFELMKESLDYYRQKPWGNFGLSPDKAILSITSNLTILDDQMIKWLCENVISLSVSIDGGESEHDRNRVFIDNRGSFSVVYDHIRRIYEYNPEYTLENVGLFAVEAENIDHTAALKFFNSDPLLSRMRLSWLPVGYQGVMINDTEIQDDKSLDLYYKQLLEAFREVPDTEQGFEENRYRLDCLVKFSHVKNDVPKQYKQGVMCCPIGYCNFMIDVGGQLHMCNKSDSSRPIGTATDGIDKSMTIGLLQELNKVVNENCSSCWAIHFCNFCAATRLVDGRFMVPKRQECEYFRSLQRYLFGQYAWLCAHKPRIAQRISTIQDDHTYYIGYTDINEL